MCHYQTHSHLSEGQVLLGGDVEVGDADEGVVVAQVGHGAVDGGVEVGDG